MKRLYTGDSYFPEENGKTWFCYILNCIIFVVLFTSGLIMIFVNKSEECEDEYMGQIVGIICEQTYNITQTYMRYIFAIKYEIKSIEILGSYFSTQSESSDECNEDYLSKYVCINPMKGDPYNITEIKFISDNYFIYEKLGPIFVAISLLIVIIMIIIPIVRIHRERRYRVLS